MTRYSTCFAHQRIGHLFQGRNYSSSLVEGTNEYVAVLTDVFGRAATSRVMVVAKDRAFGYDANGNLTNDGEFVYVWDEADRLVEVHKGSEVVMMCRYDGLSRRRERVMKGETNRYVYHDPAVGGAGWRVLEVRDAANTVLETYTHGPDLSGSLGGAGGIGGILAVTHTGATNATYFFHYDGNGNVVRLTDTNGAVVSTLDYTPFGHVLVSSGLCTPSHQFSTKEYDEAAGLNYYGYRYYSPELGRWLSLDPLGDHAFFSIYTSSLRGKTIRAHQAQSLLPPYLFVDNDPIHYVDENGLKYGNPVAGPDGPVGPGTPWEPGGLYPSDLARVEGPIDCAERIRDEVGARPAHPKDPAQRIDHCIASCRIANECPGGRFTAWIAGDWIQDPWWQDPPKSDPGDREANRVGRNLDPRQRTCKCPKGGCECLCEEAAENGILPL